MTKQLTNLGSPTFTYRKGRVFYYSRRVPSDLRNHYSKPRIVQSLRTKSPAIAEKAALMLTARLEEYWLWGKKLRKELGVIAKIWKSISGKDISRRSRQRSLHNHRRNTKKRMKESRELAKETYKKARSSKDDKEYSHPTEHDESDDLEMAHLHQGNKRGL